MDSLISILFAIFNWIWKTSIMASIVVGLVLLIKFVLKDRLRISWHYFIWFILFIRLALPWAPESSMSLYNLYALIEKPIESVTQQPEGIVPKDGISQEPANNFESVILPFADPPIAGADRSESVLSENKQFPLMPSILMAIWILGVFTLSAYLTIVSRSFARTKSDGLKIENETIVNMLERCKRDIGIKANVSLLTAGQIETPTLYGFLRPAILLPEKRLEHFTLNEYKYVFLHELVHLKRKDIVMNWFMTVLLILHWFNPILWYAYRRMREDQELSCDAIAVSHIPDNEVKEYGFAIIKLLRKYAPAIPLPSATAFSTSKAQLKRRIKMITLFKKSPKKWSALGLAIVVLLGVIALTNGKEAAGKEDPVQNPEVVTADPKVGNDNSDNADTSVIAINSLPFPIEEQVNSIDVRVSEENETLNISKTREYVIIQNLASLDPSEAAADAPASGQKATLRINLDTLSYEVTYYIDSNTFEVDGKRYYADDQTSLLMHSILQPESVLGQVAFVLEAAELEFAQNPGVSEGIQTDSEALEIDNKDYIAWQNQLRKSKPEHETRYYNYVENQTKTIAIYKVGIVELNRHILFMNDSVQTKDDIRVGSSRGEVLEKLGEPNVKLETQWSYMIGDYLKFHLYFDNDKVKYLVLRMPL